MVKVNESSEVLNNVFILKGCVRTSFKRKKEGFSKGNIGNILKNEVCRRNRYLHFGGNNKYMPKMADVGG